MKKFLFTLTIMMTCITLDDSMTNQITKCTIHDDNTTCYIFKGYSKGGISCIKN